MHTLSEKYKHIESESPGARETGACFCRRREIGTQERGFTTREGRDAHGSQVMTNKLIWWESVYL